MVCWFKKNNFALLIMRGGAKLFLFWFIVF